MLVSGSILNDQSLIYQRVTHLQMVNKPWWCMDYQMDIELFKLLSH